MIFSYFQKNSSWAPLAVFRMVFGMLMFFSVVRFGLKGWIYELYIEPSFHFKYYGFEWVEAPGTTGMYTLFVLMALSALGIALGFLYRLSAVVFFLSFTYVELIDVSNYLNHYYFVSLIAFLLIGLPAHYRNSLDVRLGWVKQRLTGRAWYIDLIRIQLSLVYFYAGLAKLNPEWLIEALPLRLWLPSQSHLPLIGPVLEYEWVAYAFSWMGALYDLAIPFFLWHKKSRPYAYIMVIVFHGLTWLLFPIGVFPWVMIFCTLIFFSPDFHQRLLNRLAFLFPLRSQEHSPVPQSSKIFPVLMSFFLLWQVLWPWRFLAYPGKLFWTEQGYRFSWRVMLMEKVGYVTYRITDPATGRSGEAYPSDYLTPNQEKQLATQPDLILQFAHFLEEEYQRQGIADPVITAEAYVTLNGQGSRLFIDPEVDLSRESDSFADKHWILPYAD